MSEDPNIPTIEADLRPSGIFQWFKATAKARPMISIGILVFLTGFVMDSPKLLANLQTIQQAQTTRTDGQRQKTLVEAHADNETKLSESRAKLAASRYVKGCIFLASRSQPGRPETVKEGRPVYQNGSAQTIPDGTTVCDRNGNTGMIQGGVMADVAFTGDRAVINSALTAQGLK